MKIAKLTREQEADLPAFRERWRADALRLQWASDEAIRSSVEALYMAAGLKKPTVMIFDSPLFCLWARSLLRGQLGDQLRGQLGDQLWDQLWEIGRASCRERV